ncbi:hypothetical protein CPC16_001495 [Podila verticillata]|nr:hypothetical protein CPC16_001495 [Podila verticillata]
MQRDALGEMSFTLTLSKKAASKARRTQLGYLEGVTIGSVDGDETEDQNELLGPNLDDTDGDDEDEMRDIMLYQWDKMNRQKPGKWKSTLTHGIMSINNCDNPLREAKGEFQWQEAPM